MDRHTNNILQSISRTTVYHSQSRFTKIVIVIVRDKISRIFYVSDFIYKTKIYLRIFCGQSAAQLLMDWRVACHRRWDHHKPSSKFVKFSLSLFCLHFCLCSVYFPIISDNSSDEFWFATNWAFFYSNQHIRSWSHGHMYLFIAPQREPFTDLRWFGDGIHHISKRGT